MSGKREAGGCAGRIKSFCRQEILKEPNTGHLRLIRDIRQRVEEFLTPKEKRKRQIRNRMVYNDWRLHSFVQMLASKRLRFGKEFSIISTRDRTKMRHVCKHKQDMPLWKRTYYCVNCGLVMDRDANSAVNIYQRFVAWPGPHTQL